MNFFLNSHFRHSTTQGSELIRFLAVVITFRVWCVERGKYIYEKHELKGLSALILYY